MNENTRHIALGVIDVQPGFMPAEEGVRLGLPGFGELPVPGGQEIVPKVNRLMAAFAAAGHPVFTTQDFHPRETAHFSDAPDYETTWPVHCVGGTPGAELHPGLVVPEGAMRLKKGTTALRPGEPDNSYSGYNGRGEYGERLSGYLSKHDVRHVALTGLALDYCVGKTALDLRLREGLDVTVVLDATRGIADESVRDMLAQFALHGIKTTTADELLAQL